MRRTKEEAAQTRDAILQAALSCFDRHGIASSTLDQIAAEAQVTKGAIYHHFDGKQAIFQAIREQVSLPLLDEADCTLLHHGQRPALERVEGFLLGVVSRLENDRRARRALSVMHFKCEYVDGLAEQLASGLRSNDQLTRSFEAAYREAERAGEMRPGMTAEVAALETIMFLNGLIRLWLLHTSRSPLRRTAAQVVRAHVESRRASPLDQRR
jgi:TetR/AcrR family acrAB operon transcriptional repressor